MECENCHKEPLGGFVKPCNSCHKKVGMSCLFSTVELKKGTFIRTCHPCFNKSKVSADKA